MKIKVGDLVKSKLNVKGRPTHEGIGLILEFKLQARGIMPALNAYLIHWSDTNKIVWDLEKFLETIE